MNNTELLSKDMLESLRVWLPEDAGGSPTAMKLYWENPKRLSWLWCAYMMRDANPLFKSRRI